MAERRDYTVIGGPDESQLAYIGEVSANNHRTAMNEASRQFRDDLLGGDIVFVIPSSSVHEFIYR
jgi:hypothetical protein